MEKIRHEKIALEGEKGGSNYPLLIELYSFTNSNVTSTFSTGMEQHLNMLKVFVTS